MQSSIYILITFMVFTSAKQLKLGPQVFPAPQSSSSSSQQPNKRYVTQEYKLYFTPDEIKSLQRFKTFENVEEKQSPVDIQLDQQNEGDQLKWYKNQFLARLPLLKTRGLGAYGAQFENYNSESNIPQGTFQYTNLYPEQGPQDNTDVVESLIEKANNYENNNNWQKVQEDNTKPENDLESAYDLAERVKNFENYYRWQKEQDKSKQESDLKNESLWKSYPTVSAENKENDNLLNNKLKQQWNRILDHNRNQLKSITAVVTEPQKSKQTEKSAEETQSRSEIEKEIESILRNHRNFEFSQQSDSIQEEDSNQRPPILVRKEVSVTKHFPVPLVKKVNVPVPTPVLVPVPEPFEVKNPQLQSVPLKILRYLSSER